MPYRIFVVDSRPTEELRAWIDHTPDLALLGHATTARDALMALGSATPDLVLADATLATANDVALVTQIRDAHPSLPVLVVSRQHGHNHVATALRSGARGYVALNGSPDGVLSAIRSVMLGQVVLPVSAQERVLMARHRPTPNGATVDSLSNRQLDVLRLIGQGLTTIDIARRLGISPKTVETHRVHIKRRLGLNTANALIRWAALWEDDQGR